MGHLRHCWWQQWLRKTVEGAQCHPLHSWLLKEKETNASQSALVVNYIVFDLYAAVGVTNLQRTPRELLGSVNQKNLSDSEKVVQRAFDQHRHVHSIYWSPCNLSQ